MCRFQKGELPPAKPEEKTQRLFGNQLGSSCGNLQVLVEIGVGFPGSFQQLHAFFPFICILFSLVAMKRRFLLNLLS